MVIAGTLFILFGAAMVVDDAITADSAGGFILGSACILFGLIIL